MGARITLPDSLHWLPTTSHPQPPMARWDIGSAWNGTSSHQVTLGLQEADPSVTEAKGEGAAVQREKGLQAWVQGRTAWPGVEVTQSPAQRVSMELSEFLLPSCWDGACHVSIGEIGCDLPMWGALSWGVENLIQVEKSSHSYRTSRLSRAQADSELHSRCPTETPSGWADYAPDSP